MQFQSLKEFFELSLCTFFPDIVRVENYRRFILPALYSYKVRVNIEVADNLFE